MKAALLRLQVISVTQRFQQILPGQVPLGIKEPINSGPQASHDTAANRFSQDRTSILSNGKI